LEESLTRVAQFAVRAIPGAEGAGLTLLEENRSDTIVATAEFVTQIDDIQYSLGQGPCISAAADRQTVMSGSLGGDQRWPQFGSRVARLGVHSVVSLPLVTNTGVLGAMNVYAHQKTRLPPTPGGLANFSQCRLPSPYRTLRFLSRPNG
jgi:GAF domain-containing protein